MIRLIAILSLFLSVSAAAHAEQDTSYNGFLQRLAQENRMQPLQNPEYTKGRDVMNWRILDSTNKVIGEVDDVIVGKRGSITSVAADFNRLRLGSKVYLNYNENRLRPATNGYVMAYRDEQVENLYPTLLANIETASGLDADNFSVEKLIGAAINDEKGRKIATVEDVLFTGNGTRAAALYVTVNQGTKRGQTLALPFDLVSYDAGGKRVKASLNADQSAALLDYLDRK